MSQIILIKVWSKERRYYRCNIWRGWHINIVLNTFHQSWLAQGVPGAHFTKDFSIVIQIRRKISFNVTPGSGIISLQHFAHAATAQRDRWTDVWNNGNACPLQWRHNGYDSVWNHQPRKCLLSRLIWAQIKENIIAPRHWPFCGEFTGVWWIPRTKGQKHGKCFHLMTSSCSADGSWGWTDIW